MPTNDYFIPRWQRKQLNKRLKDRRVLLLAGARQCGKTTLAREIAKDTHQLTAEYRTLDDPTLYAAATEDPIHFVQHNAGTLIIDEIQRVPSLLPVIKMLVDQNQQPGQFLLTGSAHLASIPQAQESLAGRIAKIQLRPLTQGEQKMNRPGFLAHAFQGNFPSLETDNRDTIMTYALSGGYPEALTLNPHARSAWHRDYIAALLDRDLADIAHIHRHKAIRELVTIVAAWSSKLINIAEIASGLSIKRPTVESYINALEALYLINRLPAWTKTDYQRVGKQDKLFMSDSGLMASLLNWKADHVQFNADRLGKLIETYVYNELSAQCDLEDAYYLYHYRDRQQREIDFIVEKGADDALLAIEVKASTTLSTNAFKHLRWFQQNLAKNRPFIGIVLYAGQQVASFGHNLYAVPISALWMPNTARPATIE